MPILFNEDDHFDFDRPRNNFLAAVGEYASWGYFDYRRKGEGFDDGYQSVPVNWGALSPRKRGFFRLLSEVTGEGPGAGGAGPAFPGKTWATKTPEQAGLTAACPQIEQQRMALSEQEMASSNWPLASLTPPRQLSAAVFSAVTSACSYP
jgi:hypothetical protein